MDLCSLATATMEFQHLAEKVVETSWKRPVISDVVLIATLIEKYCLLPVPAFHQLSLQCLHPLLPSPAPCNNWPVKPFSSDTCTTNTPIVIHIDACNVANSLGREDEAASQSFREVGNEVFWCAASRLSPLMVSTAQIARTSDQFPLLQNFHCLRHCEDRNKDAAHLCTFCIIMSAT